MSPTKIAQIGKMKVNAIISGIKLVDNVLRICCFASASAGKSPQIRCTTDSVPQNFSLATLTGLLKIGYRLAIIIILQTLGLVEQSVNIISSEE